LQIDGIFLHTDATGKYVVPTCPWHSN